jgi:hypothetical protein
VENHGRHFANQTLTTNNRGALHLPRHHNAPAEKNLRSKGANIIRIVPLNKIKHMES